MAEPALDFGAGSKEALGYLKELLRVDTSNPPGNERAAADILARVLAREAIAFETFEREPSRTNLVARLPGSGRKPPLLLSGHLDVVPAEAAAWRHPPFSADEADGCVWGRGAIDMKNMVAMSLMTLLLLKRQRVPLERDVIFAALPHEEARPRSDPPLPPPAHAAPAPAASVPPAAPP